MPWCPVCKEEYKEGITTCPECHATLVASLEEVEKSDYIDLLSFDNETLVKKFTDYLNYSKIPATYSKDTKTNSYIISVLKKDAAKAKKHFSAFYSVETSNALARNLDGYHEARALEDETDDELSWDRSESTDIESPVIDDTDDTEECPTGVSCNMKSSEYVNKNDKLKDLASTIVVFSILGVAGLVLLLLELLNVTNFMNQMMMLMIVAVVVVGVPLVLFTSIKSYKATKILAKEENELTAKLNDWMEHNFTKETIHRILYAQRVNAPQVPEEELYLMLYQAMKKRVCDQFGDLDEAYLDYIVDEFYDSHFSEDTEEEFL